MEEDVDTGSAYFMGESGNLCHCFILCFLRFLMSVHVPFKVDATPHAHLVFPHSLNRVAVSQS